MLLRLTPEGNPIKEFNPKMSKFVIYSLMVRYFHSEQAIKFLGYELKKVLKSVGSNNQIQSIFHALPLENNLLRNFKIRFCKIHICFQLKFLSFE